MSKAIHNPHDKLFKRAMSDLRVAKDFFHQHLPETIKQRIDFTSLQFHKETFIDAELKLSAADVIYSANIDDNLGYIYLLAEQQTMPDQWLPFRLLRYVFRLLEHHHKLHPNGSLPLVYPCIFYNGDQRYPYTTQFFDLFGRHKEEMQQLLTQPFQLIDVRTIPDVELRQYLWGGILEFIFKHRFTGDFMLIAEQTIKWLHQLELNGGYDYAKTMLHYVINHLDGKNIATLVDIARDNLSSELGDETMTFAQQLIQQGMQQGIQQGMQQGIQRGMQQGMQQGEKRAKHAMLERLLIRKFNTIPENYLRLIKTANENILLEWFDRIIDAKSLHDVFGEQV